eukprot:COSAG02_NODE_4478_length_5321_cov_7.801226_9_plen_251_part_00
MSSDDGDKHAGGSGPVRASCTRSEPSLPPGNPNDTRPETIGGDFWIQMRELRPLFVMAFMEVCSIGLISARLPILLTTYFAREHSDIAAWHSSSSGRCEVSLSWVSPSSVDLQSNATALAAACPLAPNAATPCCAADGRLSFPDSCPPGVTAIASAQPGNNFYYPYSAICTAGNAAAVRAQSSSDAAILLLTFVCSPVLGKIADAYGRRPMLVAAEMAHLLPSVALLLWAYVLSALSIQRTIFGYANSAR